MLSTVSVPRGRRKPACHPERLYWARGKCQPCYSVWYHQTVEKKKPGEGVPAKKALNKSRSGVAITNGQGHEPVKPEAYGTEPRVCWACGVKLLRWYGERQKQWERRECCSIKCEVLKRGFGPDWKVMFPGARYQWLRDTPDRCQWRGCGGRMIVVTDGVTCLSCGRGYPVAERLISALLIDGV